MTPGTKPSRRRRRVARVPRSARSSTVRDGRFCSAMTRRQCSDGRAAAPGGAYAGRGMAKDDSIPRGRIRRTAQVGSVIGTQGARYAGTRARNVGRSKEAAAEALEQRHIEAAERMVQTLGKMKGAAMKVGQLASFIDTEFLPPEYRELYQSQLAELRTSAPPMPFDKVREVLDEEWDELPEELFEDFDEE